MQASFKHILFHLMNPNNLELNIHECKILFNTYPKKEERFSVKLMNHLSMKRICVRLTFVRIYDMFVYMANKFCELLLQ
jgi:hypothetical protein